MKREFLRELGIEKELEDKIMAEYGRTINSMREENESLSTKVSTYEEEISKMKESSQENENWKSKFQELDERIQQQEAEKKAKEADDLLTQRISKTFGDKEFINELTKKALIGEMKNAIALEENVGKSDQEIFDNLVKDQNVFVNPNKPVDIPSMGETTTTNVSKENNMFF